METFDYIVIGAGSAGCVMAGRLSESGRDRVLVLEAGGSDDRFWIRTPIGYGRTFADATVNWKYQTEADPGTNARTMYWPRGRVVGGSSSINALVYIRGLPEDFDDWRDLGNPGWGWADVRPVFERSECNVDPQGHAANDHPMYVSDVAPQLHPTCRHFFAAAQELGVATTPDFNGPQPEGVGYYRVTTRGGRRWSASDAFLKPALRRPNVKLQTGCLVSRIRFDGRRAVGVDYVQDGRARGAIAREIILSAGAVNSPQVLQLSGIGPGAVLAGLGIPVVVDNEAVGGNLQDHLAVTYSYKANEPTLNDELHSGFGKLKAGIQYVLTRRGLLSLSVNHCGGFVRIEEQAGERSIFQLYYNPITYAAGDANRKSINADSFSAFMLSYQPSRPTSRGRVDIASPDFTKPPRIAPNYLSTDKDLRDVATGAKLLRSLEATQAMRSFIKEPLGARLAGMSDADAIADFRARSATVYHPVGTCRMGPDKTNAVVGADLRVHGVAGLRVVDASVFPTITSGNTNAPTIMIAQKCADSILNKRT